MTIFEVKNLSFKYDNRYILTNLNFSLNKGEIVGLVGNNGAGKTTLMKVISGILPRFEGEIVSKVNKIGVLIEQPSLYPDMTVVSNLRFYCRLYKRNYGIINQYKKVLNVEDYLNKKVSKLSLGMKQRIGLFVALIASEEFILLDEPTNGLDPSGIASLLNLIKKLSQEYGITFIISSHILQNLDQICNRNMLLKNHRIVNLDSTEHLRFRIFSFSISQKEITDILKENDIKFTTTDRDIIVKDYSQVKSLFEDKKVPIKLEKLGISEVFFDEQI